MVDPVIVVNLVLQGSGVSLALLDLLDSQELLDLEVQLGLVDP